MDKKSRQKLSKQYDELVKKHGYSMRSHVPKGNTYDKAHQELKFQLVMHQLDKTDSILDVGCGLGDLAEFCRRGGWKGSYTGIDISKGMVEAARARLKTDDIYQMDILEDSYDRKHNIVVSIGAIMEKPSYENPDIYLKRMITRMFEISTKCIVFDIFSNKFTDYQDLNKIYVDPVLFLDTLYQFTNQLIIINHYNPYQLMVFLFKERSSGWNLERI